MRNPKPAYLYSKSDIRPKWAFIIVSGLGHVKEAPPPEMEVPLIDFRRRLLFNHFRKSILRGG
jgi:hypothetical protein